jgi:hypothetical protein
MEILEIEKLLSDAETRIVNLKEMIEDFKVCKNETSKQYLNAAINKLVTEFKPQTVSR